MLDNVPENSSQKESEKFVKSEKILPGSDGWLSPNGSYYQTKSNEHEEAAKYLVSNSNEVIDAVKNKFAKSNWGKEEFDEKPSRFKLIDLSWILIRGKTYYSDEGVNFTADQLKKISDACIQVVSCFDGATDFEPGEALNVAEIIIDNLKESDIWQIIEEDKKISPWYKSWREKNVESIEKFMKDPFHKMICIDEYWLGKEYPEDKEEVLPMKIFDILSKGYSDEFTFNLSRHDHTYRTVDLKSGRMLLVERDKYTHDGLSMGAMGDYNNYFTIRIVDDTLLRERIKGVIDQGFRFFKDRPFVKNLNNDGHIANVATKLFGNKKSKQIFD